MISFYPGPSKVWDQLPFYMHDAWEDGILSINHRSPGFIDISKKTIALLKEKLGIPEDYFIFYTSSATECWEIIAQSILGKGSSLHIFNGAFGQKWHEYTHKLTQNASAYSFDPNQPLKLNELVVKANTELIALTQNETSNGSQIPTATIKEIRKMFPASLIAYDATSSLAGVDLPIEEADIWYASVQKCFGLPAGLAILICSPAAVELAKQKQENLHYNSLLFMANMMENFQTTYTPNVLAIYLLMRSLQDCPHISKTYNLLHKRYLSWLKEFDAFDDFTLFIKNDEVRSETVFTIEASPEKIKQLKNAALDKGLYLGNGYGPWKETTFRIANFPAITEEEIVYLKTFLGEYFK